MIAPAPSTPPVQAARIRALRARRTILEEEAMRAAHQAANLWAWGMPDDAQGQEFQQAEAEYAIACIEAELARLDAGDGGEPGSTRPEQRHGPEASAQLAASEQIVEAIDQAKGEILMALADANADLISEDAAIREIGGRRTVTRDALRAAGLSVPIAPGSKRRVVSRSAIQTRFWPPEAPAAPAEPQDRPARRRTRKVHPGVEGGPFKHPPGVL